MSNVTMTDKIVSIDNKTQLQVNNIAEKSYAAGGGRYSFRNIIIDGIFNYWYEGTSSSNNGYNASTMFFGTNVGSTKVTSRQNLNIGIDLPSIDIPSAKYFNRTVVTSNNDIVSGVGIHQAIHNVNTLAGKKAVISFYAKADAPKKMAIELYQYFGAAGSTPVSIPFGIVNLTTTWQKFKLSGIVPLTAGKTINTLDDALHAVFWFDAGANFNNRTSSLGNQSGTFDITGIQLEEGDIPTPFEELPDEINLARVNRFFQYIPLNSYRLGLVGDARTGYVPIDFLTEFADIPTLTFSNLSIWYKGNIYPVISVGINAITTQSMLLNIDIGTDSLEVGLPFMCHGGYIKLDARRH